MKLINRKEYALSRKVRGDFDMKIKGNLIIFSTDNEERKDIRRLKEKKLQLLLSSDNSFPTFDITHREYIKDTATSKMEKLFRTTKFYIEQLYTWGDPKYYTDKEEIIITYLAIVNKSNIKIMPKNMEFYDINIENKNSKIQKVTLSNDNRKIEYKIETITKRERENVEYINKLVGKAEITEITAIIVHTGIKRLRNRIEDTNIAFCFLNKEFAISELQQIYEIILDKKLIAANFRKKIEPMIKKTDKVVKESAYRPSSQYTFNEDFIRNWV